MLIHCSNSVWGRSRAWVSSGKTMVRASGAPSPRAARARTYSCASVRGTLQAPPPARHHVGGRVAAALDISTCPQ